MILFGYDFNLVIIKVLEVDFNSYKTLFTFFINKLLLSFDLYFFLNIVGWFALYILIVMVHIPDDDIDVRKWYDFCYEIV